MSTGVSNKLKILTQQVAALHQRVSWIEEAIKAHGDSNSQAERYRSAIRPRGGEGDARKAALEEYEDELMLRIFRQTPGLAAHTLERAQQEANFLRERGLEPRTETRSDRLARQVLEESAAASSQNLRSGPIDAPQTLRTRRRRTRHAPNKH